MAAANHVRILDQRTPEERDRPFLPGMGRTWLLPLYDVCTRVAGLRALHERAVRLAGIASGQAVVDVGCGTGNLSLAVLAARPDARVTGLDPDGSALRRAARKARRRRGSGCRPPTTRSAVAPAAAVRAARRWSARAPAALASTAARRVAGAA